MKKFSMKIIAIVGTATLAVGLMALPAMAATTQGQGNGWTGQMQNFMQRTFTQGQHQALMNSSAMQDLMNSDPNVKAQIGQDNLNKMNQFMSQYGGNMMNGGNGANSFSRGMMNGSWTTTTGSTMMNF